MQKLVIIGNLTRSPELKATASGKEVCTFTVAVNRRKSVEGQQEADFFRVSAWGNLGNNCARYLTRASKVCVVGTVSASAFQGQDGKPMASLEVFAQEVEFLSSANDMAR